MGVRGIRRKGASPIKLNAEAMLDYASHNDLIINNQLDIDRLIKDYNITIRKAPLSPPQRRNLPAMKDCLLFQTAKVDFFIILVKRAASRGQ